MFKLHLALATLFLSATMANAFPLWDQPISNPAPVPAQCTDFSGKFIGGCDIDGNRVEETMEVKQSGCETITIAGKTISIGGLFTTTSASAASKTELGKAEACTMTLVWDAKKEHLLFHGGKMIQKVGAVQEKGEIRTLDGSLKLQADKLSLVLNESGAAVRKVASCEYTRQ